MIVDEAMFVDSKTESGASGGQYIPDANAAPSFAPVPAAEPKFEELKGDDDLPF